jgi:hypothetical protein
LTYSGLELWDLSTSQKIQTYATYNISRELNYKEHALGMTVYKDKIIIAHGRLGFSVFDTTTKELIYQSRLVPEQRPFESQAVDVVVAGGKAIFAMDNFTMVRENEKPAFRGFVIVDLSTYKVDKKLEGLDPGARALSLVNDQLYVSYDGPYWKFSLDQVVTSKANSVLTPANLIWKYAVQGRPVGKPAVLGSVLLSCFKKPPAQAGPGALYVDGAVVLDPKTW